MTTPPQEPLRGRPKDRLDLFWDGNWKWLVPALCVAGSGIIFLFLVLVFGAMKLSGAYTGALARARASPEVAAELGTPIEPGFFVMGNVNSSGPTGSANLAIPLSGPKGSATLFVTATESAGEWHFERAVVQDAATGGRIDLSDGAAKPYHPAVGKPEPDTPVTR